MVPNLQFGHRIGKEVEYTVLYEKNYNNFENSR